MRLVSLQCPGPAWIGGRVGGNYVDAVIGDGASEEAAVDSVLAENLVDAGAELGIRILVHSIKEARLVNHKVAWNVEILRTKIPGCRTGAAVKNLRGGVICDGVHWRGRFKLAAWQIT